MGVEIFQNVLPEDSAAMQRVLSGEVNGSLLQEVFQLLRYLRQGKPGEEFFDEYESYGSPAQKFVLEDVFKTIQQHPHLLSICFDGGTRGHDHWEYLLQIGCEPNQYDLCRAAVFGHDIVSESAIASQGIPIRWSSVEQVQEIDQCLKGIDLQHVEQKFNGFPVDKRFYKRRSDNTIKQCLSELRDIKKFYHWAARNNLAAVCILD